MSINNKISFIRHKKNLSKEQLAEALGVMPIVVDAYEDGNSIPDYMFIKKLIKVFSIDPQWLFTDGFSAKMETQKRKLSIYHPDYKEDLSELSELIIGDSCELILDLKLHPKLHPCE